MRTLFACCRNKAAKALVLVLVATPALSLFGVSCGESEKGTESPTPISGVLTSTPTPPSALEAAQAVSAFYQGYEDCMRNPPQAAAGQVSTYCQTHTGLTTQDFAQNLEAGGTAKAGADPIFCAQSPPQSTSIGQVVPSSDGTMMTVHVIESFGAAPKVDISVTVKMENGQWKVDNISCPAPSPAGP